MCETNKGEYSERKWIGENGSGMESLEIRKKLLKANSRESVQFPTGGRERKKTVNGFNRVVDRWLAEIKTITIEKEKKPTQP